MVTAATLPTPIRPDRLWAALDGFDSEKRLYLVRGFSKGFEIPSTIISDPPKFGYTNHLSATQEFEVVQRKLDKEALLGRIRGPFSSPPFNDFIVSPLGVVPKKEPGHYRLIHDLSFPKNNSVNSHIDPSFSTVHYELLDVCVEKVRALGSGCFIAKADLKDAFRIIPIHPSNYRLLGFTWNSAYYYDCMLPMGCSVSCAIFEELSSAIQWILTSKLAVEHMSHILDDFIFFGSDFSVCDRYLQTFLSLSQSLNLPIKEEKTVRPSTLVSLHGIEVNTRTLELCLPWDKVVTTREKLSLMVKKKKVRLKVLQSLIGSLAFACRAIAPGRTFLRRLIDLTSGVSRTNHFIRLNTEARKDIAAWLTFLSDFNGTYMSLPSDWSSSKTLNLYSDASGTGFAAVCGTMWLQGTFPTSWSHHHIAIKELLPIVLAIAVWGPSLSTKRILFHCDNMSIVHILNDMTSKDKFIMVLVRKLVLFSLTHNILIRSSHIPGKHNVICDLLSRFQLRKALQTAPWLDPQPQPINQDWVNWL